MAQEDVAEAEENEEAEGELSEEEAKAAKSKKFKFYLLISLIPLVLALAGIYFAIFQFGWIASGDGEEGTPQASHYLDLPEMVVNLSANDKRAQYLKIRIAIEAKNQESLDALQPVMPRILDMFQIYLRELRSSDLEGSAGIFRLKEELLHRINLAIHPKRINRVLFKEIIVQ
ncbi:MAG: flagellar basal body-associated FliL family protein [Pseudomonadota bacterium]